MALTIQYLREIFPKDLTWWNMLFIHLPFLLIWFVGICMGGSNHRRNQMRGCLLKASWLSVKRRDSQKASASSGLISLFPYVTHIYLQTILITNNPCDYTASFAENRCLVCHTLCYEVLYRDARLCLLCVIFLLFLFVSLAESLIFIWYNLYDKQA